jgi:hypothetical protein
MHIKTVRWAVIHHGPQSIFSASKDRYQASTMAARMSLPYLEASSLRMAAVSAEPPAVDTNTWQAFTITAAAASICGIPELP